MLPPTRLDLTKYSFSSGYFREGGGWAGASTHPHLDFVGHRFPGYNVSQMTLLDFDSVSAIWVRHVFLFLAWTRSEILVLLYIVKIVRPAESGSVEARGYLASNLSLTLCPIRHECKTARLKSHEWPPLTEYLI